MNAPAIINPTTRLSWSDCITYARANSVLGPTYIAAMQSEALAMRHRTRLDEAIADACQTYLDAEEGYDREYAIDELDALLGDDPADWDDYPTARERNGMGMFAGLEWEARHGG